MPKGTGFQETKTKELANVFLTVRELARYLRVTECKIYRMIDRGEIAFFRVGSSIRISKKSVERFINDNSNTVSKPSKVS